MRGRTHLSELSVLEDHDRIVARMPTTVRLGDARFHLQRPGKPHRLVGRVEAPLLARPPVDPADVDVLSIPVWKTAPV